MIPTFVRRPVATKSRPAGFTLVELIIAMAIFSLLLLLITSGIVQIMRIYQSGVASRRTQAAARLTMETITRDVRSSLNAVAAANSICLEGGETVRYVYDSVNNSLLRQTLNGACAGGTSTAATAIIDGSGDSNTQLRQFDNVIITDGDGNPASVQITLLVTTGADDLFSGTACLPGQGSQFCSSTQFTNAVSLRGVN